MKGQRRVVTHHTTRLTRETTGEEKGGGLRRGCGPSTLRLEGYWIYSPPDTTRLKNAESDLAAWPGYVIDLLCVLKQPLAGV